MIRFSAFLVVVAVGLLVAGVVTSKLLLVYIAIGVSGVALLALGVGAAVNWGELTGKPKTAAAEASPQGPAPTPAPQPSVPAAPAPVAATAPTAAATAPSDGRAGPAGPPALSPVRARSGARRSSARRSSARRVGLARRRPGRSVPGPATRSPATELATRRHAADPGRVHPASQALDPRRLGVARRFAPAAPSGSARPRCSRPRRLRGPRAPEARFTPAPAPPAPPACRKARFTS